MQVQKVWRAVVGFERSQVFRAEIIVRFFAGKDRKQKRQVGVICVQQIESAEVQCIIARNGREIGVELVVSFRKQIAIRVGEEASELGYELIEFRSRSAVQDNREREIAKRLTVAERAEAIAKIFNIGLLGLVHEYIPWVGFRRVVAHLGDKPRLRHIEVA